MAYYTENGSAIKTGDVSHFRAPYKDYTSLLGLGAMNIPTGQHRCLKHERAMFLPGGRFVCVPQTVGRHRRALRGFGAFGDIPTTWMTSTDGALSYVSDSNLTSYLAVNSLVPMTVIMATASPNLYVLHDQGGNIPSPGFSASDIINAFASGGLAALIGIRAWGITDIGSPDTLIYFTNDPAQIAALASQKNDPKTGMSILSISPDLANKSSAIAGSTATPIPINSTPVPIAPPGGSATPPPAASLVPAAMTAGPLGIAVLALGAVGIGYLGYKWLQKRKRSRMS